MFLRRMDQTMKEKITIMKSLLDKLVSMDNVKLSEGKILEVSKQLDILILEYHKAGAVRY